MDIIKNLQIKANYKITKANNYAIAHMLLSMIGFGFLTDYIDKNGQIKKKRHKLVPQAVRKYKGKIDGVKIREGHNIVPNILRFALATLTSGTSVTPTFKANYIALGSDSTAAANTDVQLGSETIRGLFSNRFAIDNSAYLDKFWSSAEVGGNNYNEVGIFVDGSPTANTGYLLSRIIINETMSLTETLTINASITFT